jgi:hypothetical protein
MSIGKIKLKPRHFKMANHFARFVDTRWYPDYKPSEEAIVAFFKQQSYGPKSLTEKEIELIAPLMNGQNNKELTIKMVFQEMADFWSKGWGWYIPLMETIKHEFQDRHKTKDTFFIKALIKIARQGFNWEEEPSHWFIDLLEGFTGLSTGEKSSYYRRYLNFK